MAELLWGKSDFLYIADPIFSTHHRLKFEKSKAVIEEQRPGKRNRTLVYPFDQPVNYTNPSMCNEDYTYCLYTLYLWSPKIPFRIWRLGVQNVDKGWSRSLQDGDQEQGWQDRGLWHEVHRAWHLLDRPCRKLDGNRLLQVGVCDSTKPKNLFWQEALRFWGNLEGPIQNWGVGLLWRLRISRADEKRGDGGCRDDDNEKVWGRQGGLPLVGLLSCYTLPKHLTFF